MDELRSTIQKAFELEQAVHPRPMTLRADVVREVTKRSAIRPELHRPSFEWLAVAAAVLITVAIVVVMLAVRYTTLLRPAPVHPARPAPVCVAAPSSASDRFAAVHGCIVYNDGTDLWAIDPFHPENKIALGHAEGLTPVAWSSDGRRLLLQRWVSGAGEPAGDLFVAGDLYVMNSDGSTAQLTHSGHAWFGGSFSPDGTQVVYGDQFSLYVLDLRGGGPRLIAAEEIPFRGKMSPAWSPDGKTIAYIVDLEGTTEIWTVKPDGSDQRRLVQLGDCEGGGCTAGLTWSPDGTELAFASSRYGGSPPSPPSLPPPQIYTVHADGSHLHRLTQGPNADLKPEWSPDGSRIAFVRLIVDEIQNRQEVELVTMRRDGTDQKLVVDVHPISRINTAGIAWNPIG